MMPNCLANISEGTILNVLMMMTNEAYTLLFWIDKHHFTVLLYNKYILDEVFFLSRKVGGISV